MKPAPFEMHTADSLDEALGLLDEFGDDAKVLAGGQSLVPMLALRLTRFDHLVDVNRVAALRTVDRSESSIRIGATTRHRELEREPEIVSAVPLLARATHEVGHFQIRNRGTLGGAIAHADPAAEQPAVALALDAVMEISSKRGDREVNAADFFEGTWATAIDAGDLLTAIKFPVWNGRCGFAIEEVSRRHGDFALVGVVCGGGDGPEGDTIDRAAVGVVRSRKYAGTGPRRRSRRCWPGRRSTMPRPRPPARSIRPTICTPVGRTGHEVGRRAGAPGADAARSRRPGVPERRNRTDGER